MEVKKAAKRRLSRRRSFLLLLLAALVLFTAAFPSTLTLFSSSSYYNPSNAPPGSLLPPPQPTKAAHHFQEPTKSSNIPSKNDSITLELDPTPYHNWEFFTADFNQMKNLLRIHVYPEAFPSNKSTFNPFADIFLPHRLHPSKNPRLGNYYSEHMFKISLLNSPLISPSPSQAHFFFLPFSINDLRNDPRVHSEPKIADFVAQYGKSIARKFGYWNASNGADHFYVCCHSVGREAVAKHRGLLNNAIQVTCCSSYFQRFYVSHKDVGFPQVWPRPYLPTSSLTPPLDRHRLVFYAGRTQNAQVRKELIHLWGNDPDMDIFNGGPPFPYEVGFKRSKYCLHVKGYEVNTARVSDAIHYGCIPVIISNYYDLPFANVLDWSIFSVIIIQQDVASLKTLLLGIDDDTYRNMYKNLCRVRRHFVWHTTPRGYDSFYMTVYQLWLRRSVHRFS